MYAAVVVFALHFLLFIRSRWRMLLFLCCLFLFQKVSGQNRVPCNEITADMGFTVRSVRIVGRWVPEALQEEVKRTVGVGQLFNPENVSTVQEMVRTELVKGEENMSIRVAGATSALFITSDVCDVSDSAHPKAAAIIIRPYYLRIDLFNVGNNILPVPRTARPTFYERVPAALLATAPLVGLLNDRNYGSSIALQTTTDLLNLPALLKHNTDFRRLKLNLDLNGRLSFTEPFHDFHTGLSLTRPVYADTTTGWTLGLRYGQNKQPLAKGDYSYELIRLYGALQGSWQSNFFKKYAFGGGVRFLQNKYAVLPLQQKLQNPERAYEFYALSDGRLGTGLSRLGIWFNAGVPKRITDYQSYQQLAGRFGYAVTLGRGHNNADLETTLGSGYTWGTPPPYNQFFAGNTAWNFLYEPFASVRHTTFPAGAVVRSLGEREAGLGTTAGTVQGGTSYWHLNVNFSIPVARWSRPLIPDIVVSETPRRSTLADKLKGAVNMSKSWIAQDLIDTQGLPDDESTDSLAEAIVAKDIRPTINYLADRANVYSFKPMLLFDVAGIGTRQLGNKTWGAAGFGLQMTIVVARLEGGYMHTLFPGLDNGKGNLFLRFTLQNFY